MQRPKIVIIMKKIAFSVVFLFLILMSSSASVIGVETTTVTDPKFTWGVKAGDEFVIQNKNNIKYEADASVFATIDQYLFNATGRNISMKAVFDSAIAAFPSNLEAKIKVESITGKLINETESFDMGDMNITTWQAKYQDTVNASINWRFNSTSVWQTPADFVASLIVPYFNIMKDLMNLTDAQINPVLNETQTTIRQELNGTMDNIELAVWEGNHSTGSNLPTTTETMTMNTTTSGLNITIPKEPTIPNDVFSNDPAGYIILPNEWDWGKWYQFVKDYYAYYYQLYTLMQEMNNSTTSTTSTSTDSSSSSADEWINMPSTFDAFIAQVGITKVYADKTAFSISLNLEKLNQTLPILDQYFEMIPGLGYVIENGTLLWGIEYKPTGVLKAVSLFFDGTIKLTKVDPTPYITASNYAVNTADQYGLNEDDFNSTTNGTTPANTSSYRVPLSAATPDKIDFNNATIQMTVEQEVVKEGETPISQTAIEKGAVGSEATADSPFAGGVDAYPPYLVGLLGIGAIAIIIKKTKPVKR
jgi:DNA-binding ferritin-like protein (Dps family)